jgi:hypothetical protein
MSDEYVDPSGNTEAFRSFAQAPAEPEPARSKLPLYLVGAAIVAVVIVIGAILAIG